MNLTFGPVAITLLGAGVATVGIYAGRRRGDLQSRGNKAQGVVVGVHEIRDSDNYKFYKPIIQFNTVEQGSITQVLNGAATNPCAYTIDQKVSVIYDPEYPQDFIIDDGLQNQLPFWLTFGGITVFIVGLIVMLISR